MFENLVIGKLVYGKKKEEKKGKKRARQVKRNERDTSTSWT